MQLCILEIMDRITFRQKGNSGRIRNIANDFVAEELSASVRSGSHFLPESFWELKYPPIARAAHIEGDVVVSFRQTVEGRTVDVTPVSGHPMLQGIAVENVKAWQLKPKAELPGPAYRVTFHFN